MFAIYFTSNERKIKMTRIALTQEKIVLATIDLAEKIGLSNVSFPRLAEYFDIKAPSLYNHFKNMEEVRVATAVYVHRILNHELTQSMIAKNPVDALRAYAESYKAFADEYSAVYELINMIRQTKNEELVSLSDENIKLLIRSLENLNLPKDEILNKSRMFRSSLHGFITLSQLGYFINGAATKEESFDYIVNELISPLKMDKSE